jgi:hypothetical protein
MLRGPHCTQQAGSCLVRPLLQRQHCGSLLELTLRRHRFLDEMLHED